jgi:MHS family proline/betaine transporter-like MFS transporter
MLPAAATATTQISRAQWRVIILSSLGGALEFYDFVVFSTFAQSISGAFFPSSDPTTGLLKTFVTFAVGYVARPVGGVVFSHFGDKFGRRPVFIIAMLLMSCATVSIGLLPGYRRWGLAAPACLVFLRMMQGFCLGGELPGAITYAVETAPRRAGFVAGFIFFCVNTGVAIAAILNLTLSSIMGDAGVAAWGWRLAFIFGGLLGVISFWLRLSLEETAEFKKLRHAASKRPFAELMSSTPVAAFVGVAALTCTAGFNGLLFAMPAFLPSVMHYTPHEAAAAQNAGLLVLSFGLLATAWLGDRIPRRWILGCGSFAMAVLSLPFYSSLAAHSMNLYVLFALVGLVASFSNGPMCGLVADLYPTRLRFSGIAVSFNLAFSIFSGLAGYAALKLASVVSPTAPAYYMIGCAVITFLATLVVKHFDGRILGEQNAAAAAARAAAATP